MSNEHDALREALELIDEIVLAGMSGSGHESEEGMRDFHARQAWNFISIAARAKEKLQSHREAIAKRDAVLENIKYHAEFSGGGDDPAVLRGQLKCILDEIAAITQANGVLGKDK